MNTRRFETWLQKAIELTAEDHAIGIESVEDFVQAGVLTADRGLVVRFEDGSEFQVTLVQSRGARR